MTAKTSIYLYLPSFVTLSLLGGLWFEKSLFHLPRGDAEPYHERIRTESDQMPYQIGDWIGIDVEIPPAAITLLKPNALINRRFKHQQTGKMVSMLVIQCGDARDLLGHYPPVCYVSGGWVQLSATPVDWQINDLTIRGVEYEFERSTFERSSRIIVDNFMILPSGVTARDMDAVNTAAQDYRRKFYGAAQFQFVFSENSSSDERNEIVPAFINANLPLLDAIRSLKNHD